MTMPPPLAPRLSDLATMARQASHGTPGSMETYLKALNPTQTEAVMAVDGPLLVLAGAGTGKTRVLSTRIAHILATGRANPSEIFAVTFTNKAAREMRERMGRIIGASVEGMTWLGTFHALGTKFLRRHAEAVDLQSNFTILDTDDQLRLMKQVIQAANIDEKRWPARQLAHIIDGWKNRGLTPKEVTNGEGAVFADGKGKTLYEAYQERLKALNACDFGDLLVHPLTLLRRDPALLATYQARFKYLLVDEYQDTNAVQYLILRLLAQKHRNICCVGDDDQAIYGWRGAEVDNILRFEHDFPGAKVVRLETNYRSTGHILACASHLIAFNRDRLGKTLHTTAGEGEKPTLTSAWDAEEEARWMGEKIEDLQRARHNLNEVAILVRASFQMREIEDRLVTMAIPYRVIGGPRFYERAEIRDAMAYLRCIHSVTDDLAFERIMNTPKRGLGDATLKLLHEQGRRLNLSLMQTAEQLIETDEIKPKARNALRELIQQFKAWQRLSETEGHAELARRVLDESGYTTMWQQEKTPESAGRLENLKELVRSMEEYPSLEAFLEHVALVMDTEQEQDQERVSLMTIHAAKGLEFDTVFLPGWEEGVFPHQRALDEQGKAGLEEERRLAYVAITRARHALHILFAANRRIHGLWQAALPSRFIDELPHKHIHITSDRQVSQGYTPSRFDNRQSFSSGYTSPGWQRAQNQVSQRAAEQILEARVIERQITTQFSSDERVFHIKFGMGTVRSCDGNKVNVDFDKAGSKMVMANYLEKVTS